MDVWHSRTAVPTRRVALGEDRLRFEPSPGAGGLLLAAIVAFYASGLTDNSRTALAQLAKQLERGESVAQPRLRYRLQKDRVGLTSTKHRLVGTASGDICVELDRYARGEPQLLAAMYRASAVPEPAKSGLFALLRAAMRWRSDEEPDQIDLADMMAYLTGREPLSTSAAAAGGWSFGDGWDGWDGWTDEFDGGYDQHERYARNGRNGQGGHNAQGQHNRQGGRNGQGERNAQGRHNGQHEHNGAGNGAGSGTGGAGNGAGNGAGGASGASNGNGFRNDMTARFWALHVMGMDSYDGNPKALQRQFRRQLRQAHPDHGGEASDAGDRIAALTAARKILLTSQADFIAAASGPATKADG